MLAWTSWSLQRYCNSVLPGTLANLPCCLDLSHVQPYDEIKMSISHWFYSQPWWRSAVTKHLVIWTLWVRPPSSVAVTHSVTSHLNPNLSRYKQVYIYVHLCPSSLSKSSQISFRSRIEIKILPSTMLCYRSLCYGSMTSSSFKVYLFFHEVCQTRPLVCGVCLPHWAVYIKCRNKDVWWSSTAWQKLFIALRLFRSSSSRL